MSAEPRPNDLEFDTVRRDWASRGYSCAIWIDPPGQEWRDFIHDTDELLMVIDGTVELEMHDTVTRPSVGEEVVIPAGARHTVRNAGKTDSHWYYGYGRDCACTD
jgi:mannose-6-phosphate isomerase-like protein (cupin superfamily)